MKLFFIVFALSIGILINISVIAGGLYVCNEVHKELQFKMAEDLLIEYEWQQQWN